MMNPQVREYLVCLARNNIKNGSSNDFSHAFRVLKISEYLASKEGGDLEILIPAALFYNFVVYPDSLEKSLSDSIRKAQEILNSIKNYPREKISEVVKCIEESPCALNKEPHSLESKILQDAAKVEETGAIAIMRTFATAGVLDKKFYNTEDPFCEIRLPNSRLYALDLFYDRLLIVADHMNTETAKQIALDRSKVLYEFIESLRLEIDF